MAFHNLCVPLEPVQIALREAKTQQMVLGLTSSIYVPGLWRLPSSIPQESLAEAWSWRSGISAWSWRVLEVLTETGNGKVVLRYTHIHGF